MAETLGSALARRVRQTSRILGWRSRSARRRDARAGARVAAVVRRCCSIAFFRTNLGTAMRAAGDNAQMIRALGVNVDNMIVLGPGAVERPGRARRRAARAVSGLRRRADGHRHGGVGPRERHHRRGAGRRAQLGFVITGAVMGSVLFRLLVAIALRGGLDPNDLKLVTAAFVFAALDPARPACQVGSGSDRRPVSVPSARPPMLEIRAHRARRSTPARRTRCARCRA